MTGIEFDESRWPIVTITFNQEVDDEEYGRYLKSYTSILNRARMKGSRIVCIMDASASPNTPKHQQKMQSAWIKEHKQLIGGASAGAAFVITSALQRFILSGIFLIAPMAAEYKVFATWGEAAAWAQKQLRTAMPTDGRRAPIVRSFSNEEARGSGSPLVAFASWPFLIASTLVSLVPSGLCGCSIEPTGRLSSVIRRRSPSPPSRLFGCS